MKQSYDNDFVMKNIGLAQFAVRLARCPKTVIEKSDQFQLACIGLINAARSHDDSLAMFSTYAVRCAVNEIGNVRRSRQCGRHRMPQSGSDESPEPDETPSPIGDPSDPVEARETWIEAMKLLDELQQRAVVSFANGASLRELKHVGVSAIDRLRKVLPARNRLMKRDRELAWLANDPSWQAD